MRQAELERSGLPPREAADASRRALGNVTLAREDARAVWVWRRSSTSGTTCGTGRGCSAVSPPSR